MPGRISLLHTQAEFAVPGFSFLVQGTRAETNRIHLGVILGDRRHPQHVPALVNSAVVRGCFASLVGVKKEPQSSCFTLFRHFISVALAFALAKAGNNKPARIAMMVITTSNSISVNPALFGCEFHDDGHGLAKRSGTIKPPSRLAKRRKPLTPLGQSARFRPAQ